MIRYLLDPNVSRSEPALNCWTLDRKVAVPFRSHDFDKAERPAGQAKAGTGPGAQGQGPGQVLSGKGTRRGFASGPAGHSRNGLCLSSSGVSFSSLVTALPSLAIPPNASLPDVSPAAS